MYVSSVSSRNTKEWQVSYSSGRSGMPVQDHKIGKQNKAAGYVEKEKACIPVCVFLSEVTFKHTAVFLQDCQIFAVVS